jgi:hypothetical protein
MTDEISTAYELPFNVKYGGVFAFRGEGEIKGKIHQKSDGPMNSGLISESLHLFCKLARTGALAGRLLSPSNSHMSLVGSISTQGAELTFYLAYRSVDPGSLVVFTNLLLAIYKSARIEQLQLGAESAARSYALACDPQRKSTYPLVSEFLQFKVFDDEPEGGGYTFTAMLKNPMRPEHAEILLRNLTIWVESVRAGVYGLAPIPPEESYVETYEDALTYFDLSVEWSVLKVRADSACINGVVNIFGAFHDTCQELISLTIS